MLIHVVEQGETINSIAEKYNTSAQLIIYNNEIQNPNNLVVGQTIVILFPQVIHIVEEGDTVNSIAAEYNVSVGDIIRNNPIILNTNVIYPGQSIVISYEGEKFGTIAVNGYCYPNIDRLVLRKTLPYLSFLTVFTYGFTEEGELVEINDSEVVEIAKSYNVAPIMLISSLSQSGTFSNELSEALLNNEDAQDILIENILNNMRQKGYYGLDIDFEYVFPKDRQAYVDFISKTQKRLSEEGFVVFVALAPKTSGDQPGLLYEAHDYEKIGQVADAVFLMTYEWGYTYKYRR